MVHNYKFLEYTWTAGTSLSGLKQRKIISADNPLDAEKGGGGGNSCGLMES